MATESIALEASLTRPLGGRYRLDEVVGRGGMGTVYRALDLRLNRAVAIKVLRSVEHADTIRFEAEIEILARLVHPGLVRLLDAGEVGLHPYLVMDLVEGPSLAQRVSEGPLRREETATIGSRIAAALAYVHDAHVIHRDVKPANVLLANSGDVHLADFGIARLVDSTSITVTGRALGTPAYLAPEQVEGTSVGPGTDVYALGLVLIECLSGRRAFEGSPSEIAAARLHRDPAIPWEVGEGWRHTLSAMTQRSLADRLSADDAVAQLSLLASVDTYIASITDPWDDGVVTAPLAGAASSPSPAAMTQLLPHAPVGARARVVRPRLRVTRAGARVIALGAVGVALVTFLVVAAPWSSSPAPTTAAIASHLRAPATAHATAHALTPAFLTPADVTTSVPATSAVTSAATALDAAIARGASNSTISATAGRSLTLAVSPLLASAPSTPSPARAHQFQWVLQLFGRDVHGGQIVGDATIGSLTTSIGNLARALGTSWSVSPPTHSPPLLAPSGRGRANGH